MLHGVCGMKENNQIVNFTFYFSIQGIELYKSLTKQSATGMGANAAEANAAQTKYNTQYVTCNIQHVTYNIANYYGRYFS